VNPRAAARKSKKPWGSGTASPLITFLLTVRIPVTCKGEKHNKQLILIHFCPNLFSDFPF
jgi:hypothetical protein